MPTLAKDMTQEYLGDNDSIQQIIDEHCDKDVNGIIHHKDLYELYTRAYGHKISQRSFTDLMKAKGYGVKRTKKGSCFIGLKLKDIDSDTVENPLDI